MAEEILQVKRNGDFYYPIYFEEGFDRLADAICTEGLEGRNLCIVTDTHVEPLYAEEVKRVLTQVASRVSVFVFEAGEAISPDLEQRRISEALTLSRSRQYFSLRWTAV